ncbi:MAG: Gfo/Idh/MocA family oxidoreductase [Verrucomicrobiota bacterium]
MANDSKPFRWGIIGCGLIAPRFFKALENTGEGRVVAAASKSMLRAKRFQQKTGVERIYGSYEAMLDNERLDAVYVATTHNFHAENAKLCLEHGLPVLVEKCFTQNARQAKETIALAREKNLFLMEAMWTRFNPATIKLREMLIDGVIGEVRHLKADFCVHMNPFSLKTMPWNRMYSPRLAGGALLDLGVYPIAFTRMVFGQPPASISSSANMTWTGVDKSSQYGFEYPAGARAELAVSFVHQQPREAGISGTKGSIRVPEFPGFGHFSIKREGQPDETIECDAPGFEHEIREVHRCLREGLAESPGMPLDETLETMRTLDAIRAQWDMEYPKG